MEVTKPPTMNVNFLAPIADKETWDEEAHRSRKTLSAWMRDTLNAAVGGSSVPVPADTYVSPKPTTKKTARQIADELLSRATAKSGDCYNRLPKGTYCKQCGRIH